MTQNIIVPDGATALEQIHSTINAIIPSLSIASGESVRVSFSTLGVSGNVMLFFDSGLCDPFHKLVQQLKQKSLHVRVISAVSKENQELWFPHAPLHPQLELTAK